MESLPRLNHEKHRHGQGTSMANVKNLRQPEVDVRQVLSSRFLVKILYLN